MQTVKAKFKIQNTKYKSNTVSRTVGMTHLRSEALGKLGPRQLGPGQFGPRQLGPQGPVFGAQLLGT